MQRGAGDTTTEAATVYEHYIIDPSTKKPAGTTAVPFVVSQAAGGGLPANAAQQTVTYTSSSITSATGASQTLLAVSTTRKALLIVNPLYNTTDWTIDPLGGTAAAGTVPGITLRPGDSWEPMPVPLNAITGIATAASKLIVLAG